MSKSNDALPRGGEEQYEYRAVGGNTNGWRLTDWTDKERALSNYEKGYEHWDWVAFERRELGDDSTTQRKPEPSDNEWSDVAEGDMVREVAHAE